MYSRISLCIRCSFLSLIWIATIVLFGSTTSWAATSPTSTSLSVSSGGSSVVSVDRGTAITLTAQVGALTSHSPIYPGQVKFCDKTATRCEDSALLATAQLTSAGTATFKFVPGIGSHSYGAVFVGTRSYQASSSAAVSLSVGANYLFPTTTSIAASGPVGSYTLKAKVAGVGSPTQSPTGSISFLDTTHAGALLGSAPLGAATLSENFVTRSMPGGKNRSEAPVVGDFNGDGILDLATFDNQVATISILLGNGDGTFTLKSSPGVGGGSLGGVVGDFNSDGISDLAVANENDNTVSVLLGKGDGTFTSAGTLSAGFHPSFVPIGDFNNDGIADLVTVDAQAKTLTILLGTGDGTFTSASPQNLSQSPGEIAVGDFNGDGVADLVTTNYDNSTLSVLLGNGDGTFSPETLISIAGQPYSPLIGDFNGDGIPDLALSAYNFDPGTGSASNSIILLLGEGNGSFKEGSALNLTPPSFYNLALADVNGDGFTDIVAADEEGKTVSVFLGKGTGTFIPGPSATLPGSPGGIALGDFNGDGYVDIFAGDARFTTRYVLLNRFTETATAILNDVAPTGKAVEQVEASYPGDSVYRPSLSAPISLLPQKLLTTLTLKSSANPSLFGYQLTLTATLSPYASASFNTNGEAVTFFSGGTRLGSAKLAAGIASLTLNSLPIGTNTLTAGYAGDNYFTESSSKPLQQQISPATVPGFVVTVATDNASAVPSNCQGTGSANCSLRDAIAAAAAAGSGNITFSKATFGASKPAPAIRLVAYLAIPSNTAITAPLLATGSTPQVVTVLNDHTDSAFTVTAGTTNVLISGLAIGGDFRAFGDGAGIDNSGELTVSNASLFGTGSFAGSGGGITNEAGAVLTLSHSVVSGNDACLCGATVGGGIYNAGTATIASSTISQNGGRDTTGGGIYNASGATMSLTNTTVSKNEIFDGDKGGGIFNAGTLTVTSSNITGNSAPSPGYGSGIENTGTLQITNSILSDNVDNNEGGGPYPPPVEDDCDGPGCPTNGTSGNLVGAGLSSTYPGAPAICAGLLADIPKGLTTDQRGQPRTSTYGSTTCVDSGAIQTHYSLSFTQQPPTSIGVNASFAAAVQLSESGTPFLVAGLPISLTLAAGDRGTLAGGGGVTSSKGVATYSQLKVSAAGTGDTLLATIPLTATPPPPGVTAAVSASVTSHAFNVGSTAPAPAAPAFTPPGGTYTGPVKVSLADSTSGSAIYYSTNGATPTLSSTLYTSPFEVTQSETVKAVAILDGVSSPVATATYTITAAQCTVLDYSKGFTASGLTLNGGAAIKGGLLQVADGGSNEARSAFSSQLVPVTSYTTDFTFQLLNPVADGMTFTVQSDKPQDVGQSGGGLGYAGIPKSAAVKFDLFNNNGEGYNSTGLYLNGAYPGTPAIDLGQADLSLHSGHIFAVHAVYANGLATISITDTVTGKSASATTSGDLSKVVGSNAYVGFTGGTGGLSATENILTWSFKGGIGCDLQ